MTSKLKYPHPKKKKGKFVEFNDKNIIKGNSTFKSDGEKIKNVYETPLQTLSKLFPEYEYEILETLYDENCRNFTRTKLCLEKMNDTYTSVTNSNVDEEKPPTLTEPNNNNPINLLNFKYDFEFDLNTPIQSKDNNSSRLTSNEIKKEKELLNIDYKDEKKDFANKVKENQTPVDSDYSSILETFSLNNNLTFKNKKSMYLEEYILEDYINLISEIFPEFKRVEILQKMCDFDLDIDQLILFLFDEKHGKSLYNFENMASFELSKDYFEDFAKNFNLKVDDSQFVQEIISKHNLQKKIEQDIAMKQFENNKKTPRIDYNESNFPYLDENHKFSNKKISLFNQEEDFLNKEIHQIRNQKIKTDLHNLVKKFPLIDEFTVKWVYFQYMDFNESKKYLSQQSKQKSDIFESKNTNLNNNCTINKVETEFVEINKKKKKNLKSNYNNDNLTSTLYNIISNKPVGWNFESINSDDINLNNYREIRKKLILYARRAWMLGRPQDAKIIMAKANRYKIEFGNLLEKRKINLFIRNNQNYIENKNETTIDIHGLNFEESKILIRKKVNDIKMNKGNIANYSINIITGVGNHSENLQPVLLPRLSTYFKEVGIKYRVNMDHGIIKLIL